MAFRRRSSDFMISTNSTKRSKDGHYAGFDLDNHRGGIVVMNSTIKSMTSLPPLLNHPNSYYDNFPDSLDSTISRGSSPASPPLSEYDEDPLPSDDEIRRRFSLLLSDMILPVERVYELKATSVPDKWKMIKAQDALRDGKNTVHFYLDQLDRYMQPQLYTKNPPKKLTKGLIGIDFLLTSLEVDLRSSPNATWLREFTDEPQSGHIVLLKLLNYLQERGSLSISPDKTPTKKKIEYISIDANTEYQCLLCIKAIMKNKYGFQTVLRAPRSLSIMAKCLRLNNITTKTVVLKVFTQACEQENGYNKVMQALDDFKVYSLEKQRFERLVASILTKPTNIAYQETVLEFLNAILSNATTLNQRVYFQQDVENAGFNPDAIEETLRGSEADGVREQLKKWRNNCLDVGNTIDEFVTLRGRTVLLRDEVDLLQSRLEEVEREKKKVIVEKKELELRVEDFKFRALELQSTIESLKKQRQEGKDSQNDVTHVLEDVIEDILSTTDPPEPPPPPLITPPSTLPPPPPPPASTMRLKTSTVRLPVFNWYPTSASSENSIFKELDDSIKDQIDFKEFEKIFELKSYGDHDILRQKRDTVIRKLSSQVTLLQPNRAKNLVIAKRRVGMAAEDVKDAINKSDLVMLPSEHAELLLKFVPTKDELSNLAKYAKEYDRMAEAERFLFQMAKIERYENKLSTIVYMGIFDELVRTVLPQVDSVLQASLDIMNSKELKKLFEIILAYGNFMNATRRGVARGFRLDSLAKLEYTKSSDKRLTFLHYLVDVIQAKFPDISQFHEHLRLEDTSKVSMQTLAADVQSLRKGLDLAKTERDKQPDNFIIYNFYERAIGKVHKISEKYRKMDEAYRDVCMMFDENPRLKEPADFFKNFMDFINKYKKAEKENMDRKRQQATLEKVQRLSMRKKKVAREAAEKARQRLTSSGSESSGRGSLSEYTFVNGGIKNGSEPWMGQTEIETNAVAVI